MNSPRRQEEIPTSFLVEHGSTGFHLKAANDLSSIQREYLETYLKKASDYQVIGTYQNSPVLSLYQTPLATPVGARSLYYRLIRRFEGSRIPATATLALTKACQCRCQHCSAVFYNKSLKPELTTRQWKEAIAETVSLGVTQIIFLGGEPLLRPDLPLLISSVPAAKAITTLFTNGEFLTPERCQRLADAGLMGAFVSLDDTEAATHDELRCRPGLFQKALNGIECLHGAGLLTAISSYLSPKRLELGYFEKIMELGKKLGVSEVTFFDAIPSGQWLKSSEHLLQEEDRGKILRLVRAYRQRDGYPGISAQSTMTSETGSAFCFAANTQFYLTAHGEMCPCDFTPLTFGRFPDASIASIWHRMITSPPYNQRANSCRMQDPEFRKKYLDPIPSDAELPWSV